MRALDTHKSHINYIKLKPLFRCFLHLKPAILTGNPCCSWVRYWCARTRL